METIFMMQLLPMAPALICTTIVTFGTIKLYKYKDCMFMRKRSAAFELNITMILAMYFCTASYAAAIMHNNVAVAISVSLLFVSWSVIFLMLNVKNWMIYFRSKWTYYTLQVKWQKIINPESAQEINERNWYICNNKKYGNLSYVYKSFGAFHFICFVISSGFMTYIIMKDDKHNAMTILFGFATLFILFIPVLMYSIIVYKIQSVNDVFNIYWESKMHAKLAILLVFAFLLTNTANSIFDHHIKTATIAVTTIPYVLFYMTYVSTFKIISKNKTESGTDTEVQLSTYIDEHNVITLSDVLSHHSSLNLFMIHLSNEFSMECLLSFIEFTQFQQLLVSKMNDKSLHNAELIKLHENTPKSAIIESNQEMKLKACELYNKYVLEGTEYEINISSTTRKKIKKILSDNTKLYDLHAMFSVFEKAKREMEQFMRYSLTRYKSEPQFQQVILFFSDKRNNYNENNAAVNQIQIITS